VRLQATIVVLATAATFLAPRTGVAQSNRPEIRPSGKFAAPSREKDGVRVLFVGNSLTSGNDLPRVVQAMARAAGVELRTAAVIEGGASLEDHWRLGRAQQLLAVGRWTYVVFQQGPSSRPESRAHLRRWSVRWAEEARRRGAIPALYMVWPFQRQKKGFEQVSLSYREPAKASRSMLLSAGDAWHEALQRDPALALYQSDRLHPTTAGTYLAALVISRGLAGISPRTVPARLKLESGKENVLPEDLAAKLRLAAEKVTGPEKIELIGPF